MTITVKAAAGAAVYYDTFMGLIPAKLQSVRTDCGLRLVIKLTASRGSAFPVGEVIQCWPTRVVPREAIYRSRQHCGQYRIRSYNWEV
jgi:hypothetical protein